MLKGECDMYQANSAAIRRQTMMNRIQQSAATQAAASQISSPSINSDGASANDGQLLRQQLKNRRMQRYGMDSAARAVRESEGMKRGNIQVGTYKADRFNITVDGTSIDALGGDDSVSVSGNNNVIFAGQGSDTITLGRGSSGNRVFLGQDNNSDTVVVQGAAAEFDVLFNADEQTIEITNKKTGLKQYIEDVTGQDVVRFDNRYADTSSSPQAENTGSSTDTNNDTSGTTETGTGDNTNTGTDNEGSTGSGGNNNSGNGSTTETGGGDNTNTGTGGGTLGDIIDDVLGGLGL